MDGGTTTEDINKIRVTNLPDITENELRELFKACGPIQRTYVAKDHQTGESKGFAFVTYYTKEDAQSAIDKFDGFGVSEKICSTFCALVSPSPISCSSSLP